jgi:Tfp pilus assembly protein PilF
LVAKQLAEAAAAKAAFARALQLDDSLVQSALELGILSVDEDNWDAVRKFFERYLEAREARGMSESLNHSAEALLLGRALAKQAGDQDAAALWERALRSLYPELELEQEIAEQ